MSLNDFLENYTLNKYDELNTKIQSEFINTINIIQSTPNALYNKDKRNNILNSLLDIKNKIDNSKWTNGISPDSEWPRNDYPVFTEKDEESYKITRADSIRATCSYTQEEYEENELIMRYMNNLHTKFNNILAKAVSKLIQQPRKIRDKGPNECNTIIKFQGNKDNIPDIGLYYNFICNCKSIIASLDILNTWVTTKLIRTVYKQYIYTSPLLDNYKTLIPIFKLYLYIVQNIYALDIIKLELDGLIFNTEAINNQE